MRAPQAEGWTRRRFIGGLTVYAFLSSMFAYVGLNPRTDVNWVVTRDYMGAVQHFTEGRVDAFMTGPPESVEFRAKRIGHVLIDTVRDRPWLQYFCMVAGHREFVQQHPSAPLSSSA
jgi:NitT/TauT family transport system substrate-binding protein